MFKDGFSTGTLVAILIIMACVIVTLLIIRRILQHVSRTVHSAEARMVKGLIDTVAEKGFDFESSEDTPKKISNMNKIYLPKILKDFPGFNWGDTRRMIEEEIKTRYAEKQDFTIYETAVARYDKLGSDTVITTETAASCRANGVKKQLVIKTELSYVSYSDGTAPSGIHSLNCPNCGAPLRRNPAGELVCEYCDTAVTGQRDWQITDIREK